MRHMASIRVEVVFLRECAGHLSASRERRLRAARLPARIEAAPLDLVAEMLARFQERAIGRPPYAAILTITHGRLVPPALAPRCDSPQRSPSAPESLLQIRFLCAHRVRVGPERQHRRGGGGDRGPVRGAVRVDGDD